MPAYDRYWRLGVAVLLLGAAAGASGIVWYVRTRSLEFLFGPGITYSNTCQVVWVLLVLCTLVPHLAAARRRDRARHAALSGDLNTIPPSRITPGDTTVAPAAELLTARGAVSADDVGLHFRRTYKRDRAVSVPWGEARLLEVWLSGSGRQAARGFSLYGERTRIEWSLPRSRQARTQKQSDIEAALLASIHTHTSLAPRTFAPALRAPDPRPVERAGPKPLGTILSIVVALLPFAAAAAALWLPLMTEPALNAYVALTFGVLGLLLVIAAVQSLGDLFHRAPLPDPGMILPPGMPPTDMSGTGIYVLRWRQRPLTRLGEVALGMLFAGNVVPLVYIVVFGAEAPGADDVKLILFFALGSVALLGIAQLFDGVFSRRHSISADTAGLHSGRQTLRWGEVEDVVAHVPARTVADFKVVGDDGDVTIEWPAKMHARPRRGTQAVTPSELAALVVARSGKSLRVEE